AVDVDVGNTGPAAFRAAAHAIAKEIRSVEFFGAGRQIEGVQFLYVVDYRSGWIRRAVRSPEFLSFNNDVECVRSCVNDRRASDANLGKNVRRRQLREGNRGDASGGINIALSPNRHGIGAGVAIGIEGVDAVMFRG